MFQILMHFKNKTGLICILLVYFIMIIQIAGVIIVESESFLILSLNRIIFAIECILCLLSHIKSIITSPGRVNHINNLSLLEYYLNEHEPYVSNALILNSNFKDIYKNELEHKDNDNDISEDDDSDQFYQYDLNSKINDGAIESLSNQFNVNLSRCEKCMIVRFPRIHHCSICKSYYFIKLDA